MYQRQISKTNSIVDKVTEITEEKILLKNIKVQQLIWYGRLSRSDVRKKFFKNENNH